MVHINPSILKAEIFILVSYKIIYIVLGGDYNDVKIEVLLLE